MNYEHFFKRNIYIYTYLLPLPHRHLEVHQIKLEYDWRQPVVFMFLFWTWVCQYMGNKALHVGESTVLRNGYYIGANSFAGVRQNNRLSVFHLSPWLS